MLVRFCYIFIILSRSFQIDTDFFEQKKNLGRASIVNLNLNLCTEWGFFLSKECDNRLVFMLCYSSSDLQLSTVVE